MELLEELEDKLLGELLDDELELLQLDELLLEEDSLL